MKGRLEKANLEADIKLGSIAIDREREKYGMKRNSASTGWGKGQWLGGGVIRPCDWAGGSGNSRMTSTFWPGRLGMRVPSTEVSNTCRGVV